MSKGDDQVDFAQRLGRRPPQTSTMRPLPKPAATGLGEEYESFDRNGKSMGEAYALIDYFTADQMREHCAAEIRPLVEALRAYERAGFGNSTDFALQGKAYDLAVNALAGQEALPARAPTCACPSGDGSLRWPCHAHPPLPVQAEPGAMTALERIACRQTDASMNDLFNIVRHALQPAPAAQEPLSERKITTMWVNAPLIDRQSGGVMFARAIEAAHGITGAAKP